jgi:hypothetical protein
MALIDDAIADLESRDLGEQHDLSEVARKWGVVRSTLTRRWRQQTSSKRDGYNCQQALSPQQELELGRYITKLTKRGFPPTRDIIRTFASSIAHRQVSESWVSRFINRHPDELISKWSNAIDRTRHLADSQLMYELYFELLHQNIAGYQLEPREKGFMIGIAGRSKRVFSKRQWDKK